MTPGSVLPARKAARVTKPWQRYPIRILVGQVESNGFDLTNWDHG